MSGTTFKCPLCSEYINSWDGLICKHCGGNITEQRIARPSGETAVVPSVTLAELLESTYEKSQRQPVEPTPVSTPSLDCYDLKRYAHTFRQMKEGLAEAVLLINGMIERDASLVEHWRLLAQTCDADHLTSYANKLDALRESVSTPSPSLPAGPSREEVQRLVKATSRYANDYMRDEAEERDCCQSDDQHEAAKEVFAALEPFKGGTR